jgi:tRNA U34 2-thiouridine synthase MnmA/TrmU
MAAEELVAMSIAELSAHPTLSFLPVGRVNGFSNMLRLIQSQASTLLSSESAAAAQVSHPHTAENGRDEVAVLLSGGVDSSVALRLLKEQGMKVKAYYLKIWLEDEIAHLNECPWEEDLAYAQAVADQAQVPLQALSLQKEYWQEVVAYTIAEAKQGRTPNPDIMCNSRIKFGMFYDYVGHHYDYVATGHYARAVRDPSHPHTRLMISPDRVKDQVSYKTCYLS